MADSNTQKYSVKVPLGDKSGEKKDTTKIVRRKLVQLKGSKPKRKAIVLWRGRHFNVAEVADNEGHFIVGAQCKAGSVPISATAKNVSAKATQEAPKAKTPKKSAKAKAKGGGKTAKESDKQKRAA